MLGRLRRPGDLLLEIEGVRSLAPTRSTDRLSLRLTGRVESVEVVGVFRAPSRLHRWGAYADVPVGLASATRGFLSLQWREVTKSAVASLTAMLDPKHSLPQYADRAGADPGAIDRSRFVEANLRRKRNRRLTREQVRQDSGHVKGLARPPVLGDRRLPYVIPAAHGAQIGLAGREQVARKRRPKHGIRGNVPPLNVSLDLSVADQRNRSFRTVQPIMLTVDLRNLTPCETVDLCLVVVSAGGCPPDASRSLQQVGLGRGYRRRLNLTRSSAVPP